MSDPLAIIAGIPLGLYQRTPQPTRAGWTIRVVPANDRLANVKKVWKRTMDLADKAPGAGAHLLLAHGRAGPRPTLAEMEERSYRAIWLPREVLGQYGTAAFGAAIDQALVFEESWRALVRPSVDSPLLLPETAFSTTPSVRDAWKRARRVQQTRDNLDAVANVIDRFRKAHRTRDGWHGSDHLVFRRGAPHGGRCLPEWRGRKLTCQLPPGFHYDVRDDRGRLFRVRSQDGTSKGFNTYTNVDPHGFVRGGY